MQMYDITHEAYAVVRGVGALTHVQFPARNNICAGIVLAHELLGQLTYFVTASILIPE